MTNDDARAVFKAAGLTYHDAFDNLLSLRAAIRKALKEYGADGRALVMTLRRGTKGDKRTQAFLRVDGPYFEDRECISFNPDGFIGFAGWADTKNTAPILEAFVKWCAEVEHKLKEAER